MRYHPCCVYLLFNEWSESNYKIGISNNPDRRVLEVTETYTNVLPKTIATAWFPSKRSAQRVESRWHKYFKEYQSDDHGGKEWFSLTDENTRLFIEWSKKSKSSIEMTKWLFAQGPRPSIVQDYVKAMNDSMPRSLRRPENTDWFNPEYYPTLDSLIYE